MPTRFLYFAFLGISFIYGQESIPSDAYNAFDQYIGIENSGLYVGKAWTVKYKTINEKTHFFESPRFMPGSVVYKGQKYNDLQLKYDVYDDVVLLKLDTSVGGATMEFISYWLDAFTIDGHKFVNLQNRKTYKSKDYRYFEVSYQGYALSLYTKYSKEIHERRDKGSIYYEFTSSSNVHVVEYLNRFVPISSEKDWITLFPNYAKAIADFYKKNRKMKKQDPSKFWTSLTNYMDVKLTTEQN